MTTRKRSDERLIRLADLLESLPRKRVRRFDLGSWCKCGTAACAVGEATFDPWFRRRGLRLGPKNIYDFHELQYRKLKDVTACSAFFGIDNDDSQALFCEWSYGSHPTPKTVAKRIRRFVEKRA